MGEAKQKTIKQFSQQMRYSDAELSLIKNTFSEDDSLLFIVRKFFLQFPLDKPETKRIENLSPELLTLIKKALLPDIDPQLPLLQTIDLWSSIDTRNQNTEKVFLEMQSRQIVIDYLAQRFNALSGKETICPIQLTALTYRKDKLPEQAVAELTARNTLILHIDFHLNELRILAGRKDETIEQTKARLAKDSNK